MLSYIDDAINPLATRIDRSPLRSLAIYVDINTLHACFATALPFWARAHDTLEAKLEGADLALLGRDL